MLNKNLFHFEIQKKYIRVFDLVLGKNSKSNFWQYFQTILKKGHLLGLETKIYIIFFYFVLRGKFAP